MTTFAEDLRVVRRATDSDRDALFHILESDPQTHCFVRSRILQAGLDPWRLSGDVWVFGSDSHIESAIYHGANLVPVATSAASRAAFAAHLRLQQRKCSSVVGPAEEVHDLWRLLEPAWGAPREVRLRQPFLVMDHDPAIDGNPDVRIASPSDVEALLPACVAMFTEEVGISPLSLGSLNSYRARIAELVAGGRVFVLFDGPTVVFKAEVGAWTPEASQLQGVWVDPDYRGRGLSAPALAATVAMVRSTLSPAVSLYVNDFNTAARKAYARVGFRGYGDFATILLPV